MSYKTFLVQLAVITALALWCLITDKNIWTNGGIFGYVDLALPFLGYLMGILVSGLREKV